MNARFSLLGTMALLMLCAAPVFAATNWEIDAGGGGYLVFAPATLTINVGDTVTFKNMGGQHNVVADDNSFTSGSPSGTAWTLTHTFNTAGTFGYYCVNHGGPGGIGMSGKITVNSVAAQFTISPGLSGNWFNPTTGQDGHGFQFEILPGNAMLAIWFVFTPDGSGQTWLYAQGAYDPTSNTVALPTFLSLGAKFPPNFTHADDIVTQWGTLTFTFTDCNNGTMSWNSTNAAFPATGNMPITRATGIAGVACP